MALKKKKKKVFINTAQCKNSKRVHTIWKVHPPPPPKYIYIYIYPDIHFREKRGGGKRGGRGWPVLTLVLGAFCIIIVLVTHNLIKADKHCSNHLFFSFLFFFKFKKKNSSLKTKVKNINLGNYQSACISRLLSIFPQAQYALHTNQYQRPHHRQHARSHLQALPSA